MQKAKVGYMILTDTDYPELLKAIKNPPFVLFYKGDKKVIGSQEEVSIGIVGTRKITDYGRHVTELLTQELVRAGCVIVSGLALGVDATSHQTTLDNKGRIIAVLGCSVDCCSPSENERLYDQIVANGGVIVSEYGLGMSPTKGAFLSRNRIIAGLSFGIVVTEGAADSGALYTAKDAIASGCKVFAVTGPVTSSLSQAPYQLIKNGAIVVSSGKEILVELEVLKNLKLPSPKLRRIKGDTKEEQKISDLLQNENLHFDELVRRTKIDFAQPGTMLSVMEMKGILRSLSAGFF